MMSGTKSFCDVCHLMLNSFEQFAAHQSGKAHKRKLAAAGSSSSTPTSSSEPVTKIVRAKPFIRFVSSKESNVPESSQNNAGGGEAGQADSSSSDGATSKTNDLFCSICVVKLTSMVLADMHYAGAKHKRAVALKGQSSGADAGEGTKRKFEEVCEVCNVPLISKVVAEAHYSGSKHEKKLRLSQNINSTNPCPAFSGSVLRPASTGGPIAQPKRKKPMETFFCHFCKVTLNSQGQLDAHYQGLKHKCAVNGLPPPRKKPFTPRAAQEPAYDPRPPQEPPYTPRPPPAEDRFPSPSHHHQGGHFGNPNGFGNHNAPIPFRPLPPSMLYPQY
ncbi:hypothetical protein BsWGS_24080 [Bradybaena similaris]